jgi:hypothetical protein
MHTGIGTPGCVRHSPVSENTLEYPLELSLYRATRLLPLPADKAGAVIVERGEEVPAHGPESSLLPVPEQATQLLVMIDKRAGGQVQFFHLHKLLSSTLSQLVSP